MIEVKRIYAVDAWCVDCKRCEVACKTAHSSSKDTVKAYMCETCPEPRVRVEGDKDVSFAVNCRHCAQPLCVEGCISGAMAKDPVTGVVTSDPEKCVACGTCVSMCPFGAVHIETVAIKCDVCGDGAGQPGTPACVLACPNRALVYVESEVKL